MSLEFPFCPWHYQLVKHMWGMIFFRKRRDQTTLIHHKNLPRLNNNLTCALLSFKGTKPRFVFIEYIPIVVNNYFIRKHFQKIWMFHSWKYISPWKSGTHDLNLSKFLSAEVLQWNPSSHPMGQWKEPSTTSVPFLP